MQKFFIVNFIFFALAAPLLGQGVDARTAALNEAVAAWSPDSAALYSNPATLCQLRSHQVSASYGFVNPSAADGAQVLDDESLSAALALGKWGNFALGFRTYAKEDQVHEQLLSFGAAKEINQSWSLGGAMHYAQRSLQNDDPDLQELRSPIIVNLGTLCRIRPNWQMGVSYDGISNAARGVIIKDPGRLRWAMAYRYNSFVGLSQVNFVPLKTGGRDIEYLLAAEKWTISSDFAKADWVVRCGFLARSDEQMQWSGGGAFRRNNIELGYAIFAPFRSLAQSQASHKISLTYRFGNQAEKEWKTTKPKMDLQSLVEYYQLKKQNPKQSGVSVRVKKALLQIRYYQKQVRLQQGQVDQVSSQISRPGFKSFNDVYRELLERYWQLKDRSFPLKLRLQYLSSLVDGLESKNVNTEKAQKELDQVKKEISALEDAFNQDWAQYTQKAADGMQTKQLEKLEKIVDDYAYSGIDLFHVENELVNLK